MHPSRRERHRRQRQPHRERGPLPSRWHAGDVGMTGWSRPRQLGRADAMNVPAGQPSSLTWGPNARHRDDHAGPGRSGGPVLAAHPLHPLHDVARENELLPTPRPMSSPSPPALAPLTLTPSPSARFQAGTACRTSSQRRSPRVWPPPRLKSRYPPSGPLVGCRRAVARRSWPRVSSGGGAAARSRRRSPRQRGRGGAQRGAVPKRAGLTRT